MTTSFFASKQKQFKNELILKAWGDGSELEFQILL